MALGANGGTPNLAYVLQFFRPTSLNHIPNKYYRIPWTKVSLKKGTFGTLDFFRKIGLSSIINHPISLRLKYFF